MIGRVSERSILVGALASKRPEFIAVYGRRRIGKTYLIRHAFKERFAFQHTGVANAGRTAQLAAFRSSLRKAGAKVPTSFATWYDAFDALEEFIGGRPGRGKKTIFLDELPWMDTPKSGFVNALEHFWNGWASARNDIVLVVCGSATSWIVSKIVDSHGGLHNRLTHRIRLSPFTLGECEALCRERGVRLSRQSILDAYLLFGGVPYYWEFLEPGESPWTAVDRLFFAEDGELAGEFNRLFASLFRRPGPYMAIVRALGGKRIGMLRSEILHEAGLDDNGAVSKALEELEQCGFVRRYAQPGRKIHNSLYQLIDNFCFFHLRFLEGKTGLDPHFWSKTGDSSERRAWCGLSFELVCLQHIAQITKALGVSGVATRVWSWRTGPNPETGRAGAQVDLVLERADNTFDLFEMKYSRKPFVIDKALAMSLQRKVDAFCETEGKNKSVHLVLVSPQGLHGNMYSNEVQFTISLDDLFSNV